MGLNKKTVVAAGFLVALSGCALVWNEREPKAAPPLPPARISATGRVQALREAVVRAKGAGRVIRYHKVEQEMAEQGDIVVTLDHDREAAALKEARAEAYRASRRFERIAALRVEDVVSAQEYDDARAAHQLAAARVDKARAAFEERIIRAPFSGRILKTYFEAGESVLLGSVEPLFVIGDMRGLKVIAEIDELDIARLRVGSVALVLPDALPGEEFSGKVTHISGILGRKKLTSEDPKERVDSKVLEAEIELPPSERLKPGLSVEVRIVPAV